MKRLQTVQDLERLRRELASRAAPDAVIRVCSTGCRALGALDVCEALDGEIARRGLADRVRVVRVGCHGLCAGAVTMVIDPKGIFYQGVTAADVPEIIERTILGGKVVRRLCWTDGRKVVSRQDQVPFYKHQMRRVLRNCGVVDPKSLEDAVAHGAYAAAAQVLSTWTPEQVIDEVTRSGLRGRGGAGFPTGKKWQLARQAQGQPKYIICNADEGDPGAFMDRAVLEGDPHLVLEGMILGAYAIGAPRGFIYIRSEYPLAIECVEEALAQARQAGLLGPGILGTGFDFEMEVVRGAGAYVCGEETSLIESTAGRRATPRQRPPFPVTHGLFGRPTVVNNVETCANVPRIFELGAEKYADVGTEDSKGTKIFSLAGAVRHSGLVEVPLGRTLREIVFDIGGGIPEGRAFKAAQMGGPCGGCVPAAYLDLPISYSTPQDTGAIMGCGGVLVLDDTACMVDVARDIAAFAQEESCGKCIPCRVGTKRMCEILTRLTEGQAAPDDVERLESLAELLADVTSCGLAPNAVRTALRYFRGEFEAHVGGRQCPAGVCRALAAAPAP